MLFRSRNSGYVFPAKLKKGACLPNLNTAWAAVRAAANLPPTLRLHDLRHTYASRAVMQGETLFMRASCWGTATSPARSATPTSRRAICSPPPTAFPRPSTP